MSCDVAIVGSGFAGSILARVLAAAGRRVLLVERGRHPRFALGESSTPLAAASLERLAARFDLSDLGALAAYGRWTASLPHLRRGLKRGFTFYHHPGRGEPYRSRPGSRMLVAASPSDAVADAHWLRADVDHHLVERARQEGVEVREETSISSIRRRNGGFALELVDAAGSSEADARWLVDASGPAGVVANAAGARRDTPALPPRGLVYAHLGAMPDFADLLGERSPPGPYPDERAAVHHLLPGGWLYRLPFDHGVSSCGLLLERHAWAEGPEPAADPGAAVCYQLRLRAPSLARQIDTAEPTVAWTWVPEVAFRLDRAAGPGWAALPHAFAFADPLFSTGIAWSLRAIERLADVLAGDRPLADYRELLEREARRIESLVRLAWRSLDRPGAFWGTALLYFAAASFQESRERILDPPAGGFAWDGFLGVGDPVIDSWFTAAEGRLAADPAGFAAWARSRIAPRDVAGLADETKQCVHGIDFGDLVRGAAKLGLDEATMRDRAARLRRESSRG